MSDATTTQVTSAHTPVPIRLDAVSKGFHHAVKGEIFAVKDVSINVQPGELLTLLDDVRARLTRLFRAPEGSFAFAVSGTGTSGMETVVANLVEPGKRVLVVVTGYFGDRLAQMVLEVVPREEREERFAFGDSLPTGLRLLAPAQPAE